jgi:hypothetical protein
MLNCLILCVAYPKADLSIVKKLAAILLIGVFFFNWFGFRLLTDYLQHRADQQLEARLDLNDYDESLLIEMRVPLNMPYQTQSSGFERIDGEIEIDGIHYKYVKRKIEMGELVLLCLPNHSKMQLESASDNFFQLVNDLQNPVQNKGSQPAPSFKSPVTEYWQQHNDWVIQAFEGVTHEYVAATNLMPATPVITTPAQPPEC